MTSTRLGRRLALLLFASALPWLVAAPASADHGSWGGHGRWSPRRGCGCEQREWRRPGCGCADSCGRVAYGYGAYGTPWTTLRQYLVTDGTGRWWHAHPRRYWINRWPVRYSGMPGWGATLCKGNDEACPFERAALEDTAAPTSGEDRLVRGLERFRLGKSEMAADDFRAVLAADAGNARARFGLLACAFTAKDWKQVGTHLQGLAAQGELKASDRIDPDDASGHPLTMLAGALEDYTKVRFDDVDAQRACGWLLVATGRPDAARAHLRAAQRWADGDAVSARLLADLDGTVAAATPDATTPREPQPRADAPLAAVSR